MAAKKEAGQAVGFALVGIGELTESQLLPAFKECNNAKPVALVSDDDIEKLKPLCDKFNIDTAHVYSYDNFDSIKDNDAVDVVYIVLPNALHKDFTVRAAKAGKHVLCEKPMATSVEEAAAMVEACKAADKKLMIAYRIQYEPHHLFVKEIISANHTSDIKFIETFNGEHIDDPTQWRFKKKLSGGGVLMDLGIYCINTVRFITGIEPAWVQAFAHSKPNDERFKEVEGTIAFTMGFSNGLVAQCGASYDVNNFQYYRCITENNGWIEALPAFPYEGINVGFSDEMKNKIELKKIEPVNQFAKVIEHMAKCVLNNTEPTSNGEEGLKDQKIIEAIYASVASGARVLL